MGQHKNVNLIIMLNRLEILLLIVCLNVWACSDAPCYEYKCKCIENLELPCYQSVTENFFLGYIDGVEFCLAEDVDVYNYSTSVYGKSSTTPGTDYKPGVSTLEKGINFSLFDSTLGEYTFRIDLYSPPVPSDSFSLQEQLNSLENMTYLPVALDRNGTEGFKLYINYACVVKYGDKENRLDPEMFYIVLSHDLYQDKQPDDAFIRIVDYKKKDLGYAWQYSISFDMKLKLYYYDEKWREFGMLENVVFSTQTIVNK